MEEIYANRREMFESIGKRLVVDLEAVSKGDTDTDIQGRAGEAAFREWLEKQLPTRFRTISASVLAYDALPTTERDCIIFDVGECPFFRQSGSLPDVLPIEGVIGSIEINTGRSGATYDKLLHDCEKLSKIGLLSASRLSPMAKAAKLSPLKIPGTDTIQKEIGVTQQAYRLPPVLYVFAERIQGKLSELANRIAQHNKAVPVSASVGGAFILNEGFILHTAPGDGWNVSRLLGSPLAYMEAEPWEVLLKLVSTVWSRLRNETYTSPDLGPYYARKEYFLNVEMPRCVVLDDTGYTSQQEAGFATARG